MVGERIRQYIADRLMGGQAPPQQDDMTRALSIYIKGTWVDRRLNEIKDLDFMDDEQIVAFVRKNFALMIPFLRAGDMDAEDANDKIIGYSVLIHLYDKMRDELEQVVELRTHAACGSLVVRQTYQQVVEGLASRSGGRSRQGIVELEILREQGIDHPERLGVFICGKCAKTVTRAETKVDTMRVPKKAYHAEQILAAQRDLADASRIIYAKTWMSIDLENRPIVLPNVGGMGGAPPPSGIPSMGQPTVPLPASITGAGTQQQKK